VSYYLEQHPGWGDYALAGENAKFGAQKEFLRRRQAFYVRAVMEVTDPAMWSKLRNKHPDLLTGVPTEGRNIEWDSLLSADFPLFGAKLRAEEAAGPSAAQRRLRAHYLELRVEAEEHRRRETWRRRRQQLCIPMVALVVAALVVGTSLLIAFALPPCPVTYYNASIPEPEPEPGPEPEPEPPEPMPEPEPLLPPPPPPPAPTEFVCSWDCELFYWFPVGEIIVGCSCFLVALVSRFGCRHRSSLDNEDFFIDFCGSICAVLASFWPAFRLKTSVVFTNWFTAYIMTPLCGGLFGSMWLSVQAFFLLEQLECWNNWRVGTFGEFNVLSVGTIFAGVLVLGVPTFLICATHSIRAANEHLQQPVEETIEFECIWPCQLARWLAAGQIGAATCCLGICVYRGHEVIQEIRAEGDLYWVAALLIVGAAAVLWPLFVDTSWLYVTSHPFIPLVLLPVLWGCVASLNVLAGIDVTLELWTDTGNNVPSWCVVVYPIVVFIGYLSNSLLLRYGDYAQVELQPAPGQIADDSLRATYECTWPCVGLHWISAGTVLVVTAVFTNRIASALYEGHCVPNCCFAPRCSWCCRQAIRFTSLAASVGAASAVLLAATVPVQALLTHLPVAVLVWVGLSLAWLVSWLVYVRFDGGAWLRMINDVYHLRDIMFTIRTLD
jgi:hypothetical protein